MFDTELSIIAQYYIRCYLDASAYKTELSQYQLFSEGKEQNQAFHNNRKVGAFILLDTFVQNVMCLSTDLKEDRTPKFV